jgi:hypothetical protein
MYTISDYARFNAEMNHFVSTLEFDRETIRWSGFKIADTATTDVRSSVDADAGGVGLWFYTPTQLSVEVPPDGRVFPGQDTETITNTKAMIRAGLKKLQDMIEAEAA